MARRCGDGGEGGRIGGNGPERRKLDASFREREREKEKGKRTRASKERKSHLSPPFFFYFIFLRRQMASVNTWKQTELVAISGLQIHFVPKKRDENREKVDEVFDVIALDLVFGEVYAWCLK